MGEHRSRRVATRTATKNQLLGQLDRAFPGLTLALPDVLGTKIGRLVAAEFADPARLSALGVSRLIRFAAARDIQLRRPVAERLVAAAGMRCRPATRSWPAGCWPRTWRCWPTWTPISPRPRPNWPHCCPQPVRHVDLGSRLGCGPGIAIMLPPWVIRTGGPDPARSTGHRDCPRCNTNRPANAVTERSAAKAVWRCAAR